MGSCNRTLLIEFIILSILFSLVVSAINKNLCIIDFYLKYTNASASGEVRIKLIIITTKEHRCYRAV